VAYGSINAADPFYLVLYSTYYYKTHAISGYMRVNQSLHSLQMLLYVHRYYAYFKSVSHYIVIKSQSHAVHDNIKNILFPRITETMDNESGANNPRDA